MPEGLKLTHGLYKGPYKGHTAVLTSKRCHSTACNVTNLTYRPMSRNIKNFFLTVEIQKTLEGKSSSNELNFVSVISTFTSNTGLCLIT